VRPASIDAGRADLVRAIASGIGEVAWKAKLRKVSERRTLELAVSADRERIARDLHDTVGQTLYGIGLQLQDVICDVEDPAIAARLEGLRGLASQSVADVRSAVFALSFVQVREQGLIPSLRKLVDEFTSSTGIPAEFRLNGVQRVPQEVSQGLYRVVHEALANVERHARATGVVVSLDRTTGGLELRIRDDGVGLDQRQVRDWQSSAHFGMRLMARSIEEIGGTFRVAQARPRGIEIRAQVPVRAEKVRA
jgi:signal transduction histidine kinase